MKNLWSWMIIAIVGCMTTTWAQDIELSEVVVSAVNYKYLQSIGSEDAAIPVKLLEEKVAHYDLKGSELYSDEYDTYTVSFYIPQGTIVAVYDKDGNIIKTIERFKNINLPKEVNQALYKRFPGWTVKGDVYRVSYRQGQEISKKIYKLKLENGDQLIKVKSDEKGNFM
ncbi:nicotinate-nucleotide adenylyltransferase [Zhouia amylolytica]|uniref:Nicotinic acid mononucleotide adenyltransferase n=1 Tax=Zhouia amylolytica AD3 TaxID=1286632 RepID=W2UR14_9FLAO|nr:nicotinate-nucleotide adenylyltransferase [Zhouia amylolytica]ETN96463.1 nicotinic acid mononucleotide adenyltransferase [Zhouia amylolytica AD3]